MRTSPRLLRAFTLIELIVVIVVLGVLAALAVPTFRGVIERSTNDTTLTSLRAISREAQALAALENRDVTGEDIEDAAADPAIAAGLSAAGHVIDTATSADAGAGSATVSVVPTAGGGRPSATPTRAGPAPHRERPTL